jgi:hypothetical protein
VEGKGGRWLGGQLGRAERERKREKEQWPGWAAKGEREERRERERVGQLGWAQKKKREGNKMRKIFECF